MKQASIKSHFDGDTMSYELTVKEGDTVVYHMFHWSTNSAIEKADELGAVWENGKPELSHLPRKQD